MCLNCDFRYHELVPCPKCRKHSLRTEEQIRVNGIMLITVSLVLTAMMGAVFLILGAVAGLRSKSLTDRDLFQLAFFAPPLLGIFLLGLMGILEGLWRAFSGSPSGWIFKFFGAIALLLFISGILIKIAAFLYFN
ncbi:MAG: hypothetical protein IT173_13705 [Acidobacteria bacterium]|nr:hypothetical protein [Acidobacteriota bacterium]